MRFTNRKQRQPPAVIIISLIDVLIVMLIFLMVTTTFRQQPALKLALPESKHSQEGAAENNLIVTIDKTAPHLYLGASQITIEDLQVQLKQGLGRNPNVSLAIRFDKEAPAGLFVSVMDAAKTAGLQHPVNIFVKRADSP